VSWDRTSCSRTIGIDPTDPLGFRMAIDGAPGKHAGHAHTEMAVVSRGQLPDGRPVTKLILRPSTGRRHQLRLHCVCLGHPIVGDLAYTGDACSPRLMLHAWVLRMPFGPPVGTITVETSDPFSVEASDPFSVEMGGQGSFLIEEAKDGSEPAAGVVGVGLPTRGSAVVAAEISLGVEEAGAAREHGETGTGALGARNAVRNGAGHGTGALGARDAVRNGAGHGAGAEEPVVFGWPDARPKIGVWISQRDPDNLEELISYLRGREGLRGPREDPMAAGVAGAPRVCASPSTAGESRGVARA
jgi:hypothetical protein